MENSQEESNIIDSENLVSSGDSVSIETSEDSEYNPNLSENLVSSDDSETSEDSENICSATLNSDTCSCPVETNNQESIISSSTEYVDQIISLISDSNGHLPISLPTPMQDPNLCDSFTLQSYDNSNISLSTHIENIDLPNSLISHQPDAIQNNIWSLSSLPLPTHMEIPTPTTPPIPPPSTYTDNSVSNYLNFQSQNSVSMQNNIWSVSNNNNTYTNSSTNTPSANCINSDSSNEEEQTTDYNNETEPNTNTSLENIPPLTININQEENISNLDLSSNNILIQTTSDNSSVTNPTTSNQYSMLYEDNVDNPFFKCNLGVLDYETDDEDTDDMRIIYFWNYEFNYDYFSLTEFYIFQSKNEFFKSKLDELKNIRNDGSSNTTGNIIKISGNNNFIKDNYVNLYLIAYFDNAKTNIEFYGIYNQEIDENKLIENIQRESIYGNKGIISSNSITNLSDNDFIVLHRKIQVV